jgi:hypothetical protein
MGLSLMNTLGLSSNVRIAHITCYCKFFLLHCIHDACQYRICKADHVYLNSIPLMTPRNGSCRKSRFSATFPLLVLNSLPRKRVYLIVHVTSLFRQFLYCQVSVCCGHYLATAVSLAPHSCFEQICHNIILGTAIWCLNTSI